MWSVKCDVRSERAKYEVLNVEYRMRNAGYGKRSKNMDCRVQGVACNMHSIQCGIQNASLCSYKTENRFKKSQLVQKR